MLTVANQLTLLRMGLAPLLVVLVLDGARWAGPSACSWWPGSPTSSTGCSRGSGASRRRWGPCSTRWRTRSCSRPRSSPSPGAGPLATRIPAWLTVVILSRDAIIIMSVAVVNFTVGRRIFYPSLLGKLTTAAQILTAGVALLANTSGAGGRGAARAVRPHPRAHGDERAPLRVRRLHRAARAAAAGEPRDRGDHRALPVLRRAGRPRHRHLGRRRAGVRRGLRRCAAGRWTSSCAAGRASCSRSPSARPERGRPPDQRGLGSGRRGPPAAVGMKRAGDGNGRGRPASPGRRPPTS